MPPTQQITCGTTYLVDEQILWLEITMQYIVAVTKCKTTQKLIHKRFYYIWINFTIQTIKVLL